MNNFSNIIFWFGLFGIIIADRSNALSQTILPICDVKINKIDKSVVDHSGNIFISNFYGDIMKFNAQCQETLTYSPTKTGSFKQIDIWSQFKIFAFSEIYQEYIILNRFLTSPVRYDFSNLNVGYISNATLNFQQKIWLVDESDFSLKLIDPQSNEIITTQQLNQYLNISNHDIINLKEYKGKLYVVDKVSGIFIFDNFGNYITQINIKGIMSINFEAENLTYYSGDQLVDISFIDLSMSTSEIPNEAFSAIIKKNDILYGLTNDGLKIYKYLSDD